MADLPASRPDPWQAFKANVQRRVSEGLPEDESDDFQPWVWEILIAEARAAVEAETARLQQELEDMRLRQAAISTAALANTIGTVAERLDRNHPYWSVAYGDVCGAVDREMALRVQVEALTRSHAAAQRAEEVNCPKCGGTEITKIHRPEVYEFRYYCRACESGF